MMFLVQCIDDTGRTIDEDVPGFPMTRDGAETMCRFFNGLGYAAVSRWVISMVTGDYARVDFPAPCGDLSYVVVPALLDHDSPELRRVEGGEE